MKGSEGLKKKFSTHVFLSLFYGALTGALTGFTVFFFKLLAKKAEGFSRAIYSFAEGNLLYIAVLFILLTLLAVATYFLHKRIPEAKGGGIPRTEGILKGALFFRHIRTLVGTVTGSMISFIAGIGVGSEGPSVLIGTALGKVSATRIKNRHAWQRYIMSSGASAGFAVATGAPLSAVLFSLEEVHKRFTPLLIMTVSSAVATASFINELLSSAMGAGVSLFEIASLKALSLRDIGYVFLLAVITSLFVTLFDCTIELMSRLRKKRNFKTPPLVKLVLLFLSSGVFAIYASDAVYSGHLVIERVLEKSYTLLPLVALLVIRLAFLIFVTRSDATGGIFIPSLAIGALISGVTAEVFIMLGMPSDLFATITLLGTCSFIGGMMRSPVMASVFFVELTGQFSSFLFVIVATFISGAIIEFFDKKNFYDRVTEKMEREQNKDKTPEIKTFEVAVAENSFVADKMVRDIMWPSSAVVVSVYRDGKEVSFYENLADVRLLSGDTIRVRVQVLDEDDVRGDLADLVGFGGIINCKK